MTRSSNASRVLGSSFHLGTTELSSCAIVATYFALDHQCSATNVGAFQLEVSVDQDLSVIVAEAIDDDIVKQRLVPIVLTRA